MSDEPSPAAEDDLPEQMRVRREKRAAAARGRRRGRTRSTVERTHTLARDPRRRTTARSSSPDTRTGEQVAVTGRVIFLRNTGKLCFVRLREGDGTEIQVMLSLADVGEESLADVQGAGRPRRPAGRARRGGHQPPRRAVRAGDRLVDGGQDAAAAAQRAPAALRRGPHPAALRRHDGPPRGPRRWCAPRRPCCKQPARHPRRARLRRGRDADPAAHQRRGRGPAVPHPPQRARPGDAAADRARARPQAGDDRRRRPGLRDRPHVPQRGPRLHARRGVLDARGLRGLRRPAHDDGRWPRTWSSTPHRAVGSTVVAGRDGSRDRPATASGARRRSSTWSPRRSATTVDVDTDAETLRELRRQARRRAAAAVGRRRRSSSSSTSSSSRTPWSSRRSSWTTPRR